MRGQFKACLAYFDVTFRQEHGKRTVCRIFSVGNCNKDDEVYDDADNEADDDDVDDDNDDD